MMVVTQMHEALWVLNVLNEPRELNARYPNYCEKENYVSDYQEFIDNWKKKGDMVTYRALCRAKEYAFEEVISCFREYSQFSQESPYFATELEPEELLGKKDKNDFGRESVNKAEVPSEECSSPNGLQLDKKQECRLL